MIIISLTSHFVIVEEKLNIIFSSTYVKDHIVKIIIHIFYAALPSFSINSFWTYLTSEIFPKSLLPTSVGINKDSDSRYSRLLHSASGAGDDP